MKILLINPIFINSNVISNINLGIKNASEPLGLEYIAALLPEHETYIFDSLPEGLNKDNVSNVINSFKPNVIGISVNYSTLLSPVKNLVKFIKYNWNDIKIVLGGNIVSFIYDYVLKEFLVDCVVIGEGELTFKELIENIQEYKNWENIKGIAYKKGNEIVLNPKREVIKNLDSLPFPNRQILKTKNFYEKTILTSRGCIYNCIYCSSCAFWGSKVRNRSIDNVIKEFKYLITQELNYTSDRIIILDDTFTINRKRVNKICEELINIKKTVTSNFSWGVNCRLDNLDRDLIYLMKEANCSSISLGIESGSPKILELLNRKYSREQVIEIVNLCNELNIHIDTGFIIGLPYETKEDIELTFDLIEKLDCLTGVTILTPLPGTPIYNEPEKFNLKIYPHPYEKDDLSKYCWIDNGFLTYQDIIKYYTQAFQLCTNKVIRKFLLN